MRTEDTRTYPITHPDDVLTARERDVLQRVGYGFNNRLIAAQLMIAEKTVEYRLSCIFAKLGVTTRTQAALWAIHRGLVSLDDLGNYLMRDV